jgi:ATP-dependent RNA helicase RhlB
MSQDHLSDLSFQELGLNETLQRGIADAGFTRCTPIQARTLPIALEGRDVAGQAQTGTGKTAAFLLALYNTLERRKPLSAPLQGPRALVLAPTRELAVQIHADAQVLGKHTKFRLGIAFGGTDYEKQRTHIAAGVDILIGTPGRLIDYFKQKVYGLGHVQVMVLDEADRMFDLGFIKDIRYVLRRLPAPEQRLNMLFSATLSHRVMELAYEHMNDPHLVRIEPEKVTADRVRQVIYFPSNEEKIPLLIGLLRKMAAKRTLVFVNTRREAERLERYLSHNGIKAQAISGDVPQNKRLRMITDFQAGELPVLIGTDVASRGLHIPEVSHVFNYDLPQDAEDYVHRIGRTARAGASGDAISFGCEAYAVGLPDIEAYIGNRIPVARVDTDELADVSRPPPRPKRKGNPRDGRRPPRRPDNKSQHARHGRRKNPGSKTPAD